MTTVENIFFIASDPPLVSHIFLQILIVRKGNKKV